MNLGTTVMTKNIASHLSNTYFKAFVLRCFNRYEMNDWGEMSLDDSLLNDEAALNEERVLAAYELPPVLKGWTGEDQIWIITEADRSYTTILFPSEY